MESLQTKWDLVKPFNPFQSLLLLSHLRPKLKDKTDTHITLLLYPRSLLENGTKKSKSGAPLPVVVPEVAKYKNKYQFAWTFDNNAMNNIVSVIQKYFDQGISVNHYYDPRQYEGNNLPISVVAKDILNFYKFGGKQIYYANSKDYKSDKLEDMVSNNSQQPAMAELEDDCESGACAI